MTPCDAISAALASFSECTITPEGARIETQCLYPSFEQVPVYVVRYGDGYVVHDGGLAKTVAWDHGRDERIANRYLNEEAKKLGLDYSDGRIRTVVESDDWLASAIVSVANAASRAANAAVEHTARNAVEILRDQIHQTLLIGFPKPKNYLKPTRVGKSGSYFTFDFGVAGDAGEEVLIDAVTPFAISVSAKFTAFSDVGKAARRGFAVYDRPLLPNQVALLSSVVDVIPLVSLNAGVERQVHRAT